MYYQHVLPAPVYMSLKDYQHQQKTLGTRRKIAIQRALTQHTNNYDFHYDEFTDAALQAALEKLRKDNPKAALLALENDSRLRGVPVPLQGVHAYKVGFRGAGSLVSTLSRQNARPVVTLTRRITR